MNSKREHLGTLVKNFQPLHDLEYKVVFNLHENTFFQKLVSKEVLEKVRVKPTDYMKSLLFLDYFSRILQNDFLVCDNLERLSKAIRDKERIEEESGKVPNKGDLGASYFSLETVVIETGLYIRESRLKSTKMNLSKNEQIQIRTRYEKEVQVNLKSPKTRSIEPFYEGIGEMVLCQFSDGASSFINGIKSRADLGALIFSDYVMNYLGDERENKKIISKLKSNDYLNASLVAYNLLVEKVSLNKLKDSLEKV
jgi:hypothetical protein